MALGTLGGQPPGQPFNKGGGPNTPAMGGNLFEVKTLKEYESSFTKLNKKLSEVSTTSKKAGKDMQGLIVRLGVLATVANKVSGALNKVGNSIFSLAKEMVKMGLAAEEAEAKFQAVFGRGGMREASLAAKILADRYGLANSTARELIATTGDLASALGLSGKRAAGLAAMTSDLGAKLAEHNNVAGGAAEATMRLTKAMLGETENVKSLGIKIGLNDKKTKELTKTLMREKNMTFEVARALAILTIAQEQSKNAIQFSTKATERATYWMRAFNEQVKAAKEAVGKDIIETLGLAEVMKLLTDGLKVIVGLWKSFDKGTKQVIIGITLLIGFLALVLAAVLALFAGVVALIIAIIALGPAAAPVAIALAIIIGFVLLMVAAVLTLAEALGEGETMMERITDGLKKMLLGVVQVLVFIMNIPHNLGVIQTRIGAYLNAIIVMFEEFGKNAVTILGNIPDAIKAAMTGGLDEGKKALMSGVKDMEKITDEMGRELEAIGGSEAPQFRFGMKKTLGDLWKLGEGWLGGGKGGSGISMELPQATMMGSVEAHKVLAAAGREDLAAKNAKANEDTAKNTNEIAKSGIPIKGLAITNFA